LPECGKRGLDFGPHRVRLALEPHNALTQKLVRPRGMSRSCRHRGRSSRDALASRRVPRYLAPMLTLEADSIVAVLKV
jgi:hypothetical protein